MNQQFGACNLSLVPLRTDPSDKSEMCSQLLFGDHFVVLEREEKWSRILTSDDGYEGWIDNKQYVDIDENAHFTLSSYHSVLGLSMVHPIIKVDTGESLNLVAGSYIPQLVNNSFYLGETKYRFDEQMLTPDGSDFSFKIYQTAMFYMNSPYLWGGRSPFGIDCSGLTQIVFRQAGIRLKRDAWQQAEQGDLLGFVQESRTGDLAFFDNEDGRITHVGIMLDNNYIIHASGCVRTDSIDNQGIFNKELNRYTHKLRIIKRFT